MKPSICKKCDMHGICKMYSALETARNDGYMQISFTNARTGEKNTMNFEDAYKKFSPPKGCRYAPEQIVASQELPDGTVEKDM